MSPRALLLTWLVLLLALLTQLGASLWRPPGADDLVALAALLQAALLLFGYMGVARARGWLRAYGWLYLCWLALLLVFVLGERATR